MAPRKPFPTGRALSHSPSFCQPSLMSDTAAEAGWAYQSFVEFPRGARAVQESPKQMRRRRTPGLCFISTSLANSSCTGHRPLMTSVFVLSRTVPWRTGSAPAVNLASIVTV